MCLKILEWTDKYFLDYSRKYRVENGGTYEEPEEEEKLES
jgi:hypothetical protein